MNIAPPSRDARVTELVRELGGISGELAGLDAMASRAAARRDIDRLRDLAEDMLGLHVRWAEAYRTLLVVYMRRPL